MVICTYLTLDGISGAIAVGAPTENDTTVQYNMPCVRRSTRSFYVNTRKQILEADNASRIVTDVRLDEKTVTIAVLRLRRKVTWRVFAREVEASSLAKKGFLSTR